MLMRNLRTKILTNYCFRNDLVSMFACPCFKVNSNKVCF